MRILLVEDDDRLGSAIKSHVVTLGHAVDWAQRLDSADSYTATVAYDAVLLDLVLPDGRGLDLLGKWRRHGLDMPVIILTALDQISDRIAGLNAGADDYLVKPFNLDELSARISAVTRRYAGSPNPLINLPGIELDRAQRRVNRAGETVHLTASEWAVLDALILRPGVVLSKQQLAETLYCLDSDVDSNTVEVHISRLRKKLGRAVIETVRGLGYRSGEPQ